MKHPLIKSDRWNTVSDTGFHLSLYFSCSDLFHSFEEIWAEETGAGEGLLVFPVVDLCSMA